MQVVWSCRHVTALDDAHVVKTQMLDEPGGGVTVGVGIMVCKNPHSIVLVGCGGNDVVGVSCPRTTVGDPTSKNWIYVEHYGMCRLENRAVR